MLLSVLELLHYMSNERTNILVAARVRPLLSKEASSSVLRIRRGESQGDSIFFDRTNGCKQFSFDHVFGPDSGQKEVFGTVKPLVESVLDGYNGTIFAYGQTGSGKTYTMGTDALSLSDARVSKEDDNQGVVVRSTEHLFSMMAERRSIALAKGNPVPEFTVSVVFVEIYNDDIIDLLSHKSNGQTTGLNPPGLKKASTVVISKPKVPLKKPNVRQNEHGDVVLDGVTSIVCDSVSDVFNCLQEGSLARRTATTAFNERSSRSHAIFTVIINQHRFVKCDKPPALSNADQENDSTFDGLSDEVLVAKMHFVDLAGSERLHDAIVTTGHMAQERFREGVNINMGLLTLGKVISQLSDGKTSQLYIPYRDSKLTRLLKDSLGGNSRTMMIACVAAADCYVEQSVNTLQYATNARNIKNKAIINRASSVAQLRAEIQMLRKRLAARSCGADASALEEIRRLRSDNEELRSKLVAVSISLEQKVLERPETCSSTTQTEPLASDVKQAALMMAASKLMESKTADVGDSTLTDSKVQLTNSFRHLYDNLVSQQAEMLALKEQLDDNASASIFSTRLSSRVLSVPSEIGNLRQVREKRRKRNNDMANLSSSTTASVVSNSCSEKQTTPNIGGSEHPGSELLLFTTSSIASAIDGDDEYRDPTYEPTPLRQGNVRARRRFECLQDAAGNRRLTRAACVDDDFLVKKSRMETEESHENSFRQFCHCHGMCKIAARCPCKRNGFPCEFGENGCQCDAHTCSNKVRSKNDTILEEIAATSETSSKKRRC